jgi:hypothetical protein
VNSPRENYDVKSGGVVMQVSSRGGRIISFRLGSSEMLTRQDEHENFGSTMWTAPQSDWGWPPFDVLDKCEYRVDTTDGILRMTSEPDSLSGFQFEKTWQASGSNFIRVEYTICNISSKPLKVGAWEVSRVPCGGIALFPDGGSGKLPGSNLKPGIIKDGVKWISSGKNPIPDHQKLFSTAREGWLAYALNGILFVKKFPDTVPENYSPQQGEVEIYINKDKTYTELENQGEYCLLKPRESLNYTVVWYLQPIPETIKIEEGNAELVSFIRQQLKIDEIKP